MYITKLLDGNIENLEIPSTIDGKPVTQIGGLSDPASGGSVLFNLTLKSVTVPETVKRIDELAFAFAENLTSVTLFEGLEEIGDSAFEECNIKNIVLPESVKTIGLGAFQDCKELVSIKLPSTLEKIPSEFIMGCKSLTSIAFPVSVKEIGEDAFCGSGLTSLTIPTSITELPESMCSGCENLTNVIIPSSVKVISDCAFQSCPSLKSIQLPASLNKIGWDAFKGSGLEQLIIPYGIMETTSFVEDCRNLTAVYAPSGMEQITVPANAIVYCAPGSKLESYCKENNISFQTDASVDTKINVLFNGKRVSFGAYGQNPTVINNRTMVPLRSIFEAMGADVQWDQATQTITATRSGAAKIVMTVGNAAYTVGGEAKTMDTPPTAVNGRTLVPVRVVAESFGADVNWNDISQTVIIAE